MQTQSPQKAPEGRYAAWACLSGTRACWYVVDHAQPIRARCLGEGERARREAEWLVDVLRPDEPG
ncbi:MAG: hypothetical protein K8H88_27205 [Sandaracinaceae bacterium]|nr:hypothetical protein [Sandaracinaceae bacterium]